MDLVIAASIADFHEQKMGLGCLYHFIANNNFGHNPSQEFTNWKFDAIPINVQMYLQIVQLILSGDLSKDNFCLGRWSMSDQLIKDRRHWGTENQDRYLVTLSPQIVFGD